MPPNLDSNVVSDSGANSSRARGSGPLLDINLESSEANSEEAKAEEFELREMFVTTITQADLDRYDFKFLDGDETEVRKIITNMCHSLRF